MHPNEFVRLKNFQKAKQRRFRPTNSYIPSRRASKNQKTATGQILRHSRIVSQISLGKVLTYTRGF